MTTLALADVRGCPRDGFALGPLDLAVDAGELVALIGPSGAGKTSLLRLVAGLDRTAGGTVRLDDRDVTGLPAHDRGLGFVFQQPALFPHLTVAGNVGFGASLRGGDARVAEQLALVGLGGLGTRRPAELSGGQRQRVALVRALATGPRLLLLDEPFAALDPGLRRALGRELRGLHDRLGLATLLVTHDQDEAATLADRVVLLDRGRIAQAGPFAALHDAPASAFVHGFVGEANRIDATVAGGRVNVAGVPLPPATDTPPGPVLLMFRPHEAELVDEGGIAATVLSRRARGAGVRIEALTADGAALLLDLAAAPAAGAIRVRPLRYRLYAR